MQNDDHQAPFSFSGRGNSHREQNQENRVVSVGQVINSKIPGLIFVAAWQEGHGAGGVEHPGQAAGVSVAGADQTQEGLPEGSARGVRGHEGTPTVSSKTAVCASTVHTLQR